ncbi:MAG: NIPSNAP family containing protein [Chloroflexi bacterium]|nr:NIPSNAP family containing protein [Chloroflexota bacterium]|tara:strand:+ start:716 stop:1042 length:327 start_codon:yes stop_codon:yes gene_type:complete
MFFELRKYYIQNGQKDAWINYMDKVIMPFQISKGMVITGTFTSKSDKGEELYIWLRRFNNQEEKEQLYNDVYESKKWKTEIFPPIPTLIDRSRTVVTIIEPTKNSVIR